MESRKERKKTCNYKSQKMKGTLHIWKHDLNMLIGITL